ncbi:hypothetical protein H2200_008834 [Cladophialophora chaetospira]|uniref:Glutathione S-transferase n=1 Tax=Cladophialophora chaetospira TaxID=386627 RepID=A0AA38X4S4_9EURO|nr:hypothetical protein H2200_008834 [Cladophialophora chaetospira]
MATPTRSSKRQKTATGSADTSDTSAEYRLIYWPGIPGRGEHIRLAFEATGTPYTDVSNATDEGVNAVLAQISDKNVGDEANPPPLAPPILQHGDVLISQTPNILAYLGPKLGLVPDQSDDAAGLYHINALTLTALDGLSNEPHDTHHPIASAAYYEEQKEEALKKAADYRSVRLPKFLGYFERVLSGPASGGGDYLYGGKLSYADLVLFQTLDGVTFAFPKCVGKLKESGKYGKVFELYDRIKGQELKSYLESERRLKYSMGIYRHYPELDEE